MSFNAILFGSIGTIVETSELQREAFNDAFKEAGLDWHWDQEMYRSMLSLAGGEERIARYAAERKVTVDAGALHSAKTKFFEDTMTNSSIEPRKGVLQMLRYAFSNDMQTAFVTTTSQDNIDAVFRAVGNSITPDDFDYIGRRDFVENSKPAPDIYIEALNALGTQAESVVAIEDTTTGVASASGAGIQTIAFPGANSLDHDFTKAAITTEILHPDQLSAILPVHRTAVSQDL